MNTQTIIFMGPQGSGKGTQLSKMKEYVEGKDSEKEIITLQSGALFRDLMHRESFSGARTVENMKAGVLHPLFISVALWGQKMIEELDDTAHVLIDGFPRRMDEAEILEDALSFYGRSAVGVVFIDTPEAVSRERMAGRGRMDDTPERIDERLEAYTQETLPVVEYYKTRPDTSFIHVDGTRSIEEIHNDIISQLV